MVSQVKQRKAVFVEHEIVPIIRFKMIDDVPHPVAFTGTGFMLPGHVMVTAWHCVSANLDSDEGYSVEARGEWHRVTNIQRDPDGYDLATATVRLGVTFGHVLGEHQELLGTPVCALGYPLSSITRTQEGKYTFDRQVRLLRGYITRSFTYAHAGFRETMSYELDMPAPAGLSGAPLLREGTKEIVGVVYGVNRVATIEELASVDPITGERTPELQKIEVFALAHHTTVLRNLSGAATNGLPLAAYVARE